MSFLNPLLLAGLAAISVPILIHLLNRRKFRKVTWAAMRFLQNAIEQNQRRMRVEDMILLALRCLLVALIALALARPAILSDASAVFGQSKVTGVIVLDNSLSMGMSDGTDTRFEKARRAALQALESMPSGSATAVFLASDAVRAVIPEPTFDLNLARKALREATLTDRASELSVAFSRALELLGDRIALRKEVYLITDGQATGWKQLTEIQRALERTKSEIKTRVILVNEHEERNLSVSGLRMASGLCAVGQLLRFEAQVSNHGGEEARNVRIGLGIDGEKAGDEFTIDTLPAGATRGVTLFAKLREPGFHSVAARIPTDRLPADDQRTLVVRAIREARVLLVDGEPGVEPRDSEVFFLRNALVPVAPDAAEEYFVKATTISAPELSQARLDDFDAVVLANVPAVGESLASALDGYVRRGGGLMVFPGAQVDATSYNEQLFSKQRVLPAEFGELRGQLDKDDAFVTLQEKAYEHPIVELWNDPGAGRLGGARFFRWFELKLPQKDTKPAAPVGGEDGELPRVVVRYSDGSPAIVERALGLGRVVQFGSTADTAWNDLPVRLAWVPLLHRTLGSLVERQDEGLNVRVGERFTRRVSAELLDKDATFFPPRQGTTRELRRVSLVNGTPTVQFEQTDLAGVYDASVGEDGPKLKFATQPDAGESSLVELSAAQLATLKGVAEVIPWSPGMALDRMMERSRTGLEFWGPLAVGCVLLALLEMFLAQWFSRSK